MIDVYFYSHYHYGDVDVVDIPKPLALTLSLPGSQTPVELDFSGLSEQVESPHTELEADPTPSKEAGISYEGHLRVSLTLGYNLYDLLPDFE